MQETTSHTRLHGETKESATVAIEQQYLAPLATCLTRSRAVPWSRYARTLCISRSQKGSTEAMTTPAAYCGSSAEHFFSGGPSSKSPCSRSHLSR